MRTSVVIAGALAVTFVVGRLSARKAAQADRREPASLSAPDEGCGNDRQALPRVSPASLAVGAGELERDADRELRAAQARVDRATYLIDQVFKRLAVVSMFDSLPSPEAQATAVAPYLRGVVDGALQADPGMRVAFKQQVHSRLCTGAPKDAEVITLAKILTAAPDMATAESFDCVFTGAKEDVALWSMMDAWRNSGLPKTDGVARLQASAKDPRTLRRLLSLDEERERRNVEPGGRT